MAKAAHRINFRVYYEDTDAGGIVYYANYLRFTERARTEWLREMGYSGPEFFAQGLAFVVRRVEVDFIAPARLDDVLCVSTSIESLANTHLFLRQNIHSANCASPGYCNSRVQLVCIDLAKTRPVQIPQGIRAALIQLAPRNNHL